MRLNFYLSSRFHLFQKTPIGSDEIFNYTQNHAFGYVPCLQPVTKPSFAVGVVTVENFGRYVLSVGSAEVVTIAEFQIKNLLDLIDVLNRPAGTSKS